MPMLVATATIRAARAMLVTRIIIESRLRPVTIR